jgi:hypothetical protein
MGGYIILPEVDAMSNSLKRSFSAKSCVWSVWSVWLTLMTFSAPMAFTEDKPIRIIAFGAHPDDCDLGAGGLAIKYAALGDKVKFVS